MNLKRFAVILAVALMPTVAVADGFWCRWHPTESRIQYATFSAAEADGIAIRVTMEGALLTAAGGFHSFASPTRQKHEITTPVLSCHDHQNTAPNGTISIDVLKEARVVGTCRIFYSCPAVVHS